MNLESLNRFEDGARVDEAALREPGLANGTGDGIKILGDGELTKKLTVSAHAFSASAKAKIEAKGGTCEVVTPTKAGDRQGLTVYRTDTMLAAIANTFSNCFKIPELKSRILFTLLVLAICRLEAVVRVPGLDGDGAGGVLRAHTPAERASRAGHVQHVHRRRAGALRRRRAGHHALHQRDDHHPVADGGCPAA